MAILELILVFMLGVIEDSLWDTRQIEEAWFWGKWS